MVCGTLRKGGDVRTVMGWLGNILFLLAVGCGGSKSEGVEQQAMGLQTLRTSEGVLSPAFSPSTFEYVIAVGAPVQSLKLTATADAGGTVSVSAPTFTQVLADGQESVPLGLVPDAVTRIVVEVHAGDKTLSYGLRVMRGQQAYVKPLDLVAQARFGYRTALSADGNTLAVSALQNADYAMALPRTQAAAPGDYGAVYVFVREGASWRQDAVLRASNAAGGSFFGTGLALSADGRTLAVGAKWEYSSATGVDGDQNNSDTRDSGAVYVFVRQGSWQQQAYVKASNTGQGDAFGMSVALSANGDVLAVGAPFEDGMANDRFDSGAVYVYRRSAGRWSHESYVKATDAAESDSFGESVALSDDGLTLAVGATGVRADPADPNSYSRGAVYLFSPTAGTWRQGATLKPLVSSARDFFGCSVALSTSARRGRAGTEQQRHGRGRRAQRFDHALERRGLPLRARRRGVAAGCLPEGLQHEPQ